MVTKTTQRDPITYRVHRIFLDKLELDVEPDTNVIESGALDSVSFVKLLLELEESFGVSVDVAELDLADFQSVSSVARLVADRHG